MGGGRRSICTATVVLAQQGSSRCDALLVFLLKAHCEGQCGGFLCGPYVMPLSPEPRNLLGLFFLFCPDLSLPPLSTNLHASLSFSNTHTHTPTYLTLKACNDRSIVHSLHLKICPGFKFQTEVKLYSVQMFIYCIFIREDK